MTDLRPIGPFSSVLGPELEQFVSEKRSIGYQYNNAIKILRSFDQWWSNQNGQSAELTCTALEGWFLQTPTEGLGSLRNRTGAVRQFLRYEQGLGKECWVPSLTVHVPKPAVHIMSSDEIREFFTVADNYVPGKANASTLRMASEYPVIFRLIASTGLRNGEAVSLRLCDVDTVACTLKILGGKARKDRIVHMASDMTELLDAYIRKLGTMPDITDDIPWVFPGLNPLEHLSSTVLRARFRAAWAQTDSSKHCEKMPTVHSLRHWFVVRRIDSWTAEGADLQTMMPYLARHLGHSNPADTFRDYYHQVDESLHLLRKNDSSIDRMIPEVMPR